MDQEGSKKGKQNNTLPLWGNESSMNLNPLILTNIQGSSYFKVHLFKLKTYHEIIDEIYYQVKHLEPWEKGSRKTAGQTGMCGGVRGVGAGGIVSTAFCLLYKLYTLRLTRKQVNGLLTHTDSSFIRALGFMYIRYTQPPGDLFDWYEPYLQDEEEIDPKAGGGQTMTIGNMLKQWLVKLDWFSTLFPRIPVPIQKQIEKRLADYHKEHGLNEQTVAPRFQQQQQQQQPRREENDGYDDRKAYAGNSSRETDRDRDFRGERSATGGSRDYHKFDDRGREDNKYYSKHESGRDKDRSEKHATTKNYDKYDRYEKSRERDKSYKDEYDRYEEKEYRREKEYSSSKSASSSSYTKHRDDKRYRD